MPFSALVRSRKEYPPGQEASHEADTFRDIRGCGCHRHTSIRRLTGRLERRRPRAVRVMTATDIDWQVVLTAASAGALLP